MALKITDSNGCTDSIRKPDIVTTYYAAANFGSVDSFSCPGKPVRFTDRSFGPVFSRTWYFGDGSVSTDPNPLHIYQSVGLYTVKLVIFSAGGCVDSITKMNYISIGLPSAKFSVSDTLATCPPLQVRFTDSSTYVANYLWSLGDGSVSTVQNPAANYFLPGLYNIKLLVSSPGGCRDSAFATIQILGPNGVITYSPVIGCIPVPAKFSIRTTGAINFTFDFGDGYTVDGADFSATHTYQSGGKFIPKVLIQNREGCIVPIIGKDTVFIEDLTPRFYANSVTICDTAAVQFTDSSIATGQLTYKWNFGDGFTSTSPNPNHSYTSTGIYSVKQVIISSLGCSDSVTYDNYLEVFPLPRASIVAKDQICAGDITFSAAVVPDPKAIVTGYLWHFGNLDSSTSAGPVTQNFSAGNYFNSLTVTSDKGCSATFSKSLLVNPLPVLVLSNDTTICHGDTIQLSVTGASQYTWMASSASINCSNCATPLVFPIRQSSFMVTGTSSVGCISRDTVNVGVLQPYSLSVQPFYDLCLGSSVQLSASGAPLYNWSPGTSLSSASSPNPVASPTSTVTYLVTGFDSLKCFTDTASVLINVRSVPTVQLGNDITVSAGNQITLTPQVSADVVRYTWTPSSYLSCASCATTVATATANITYQLQVATQYNCTATDDISLIVTCDNAALFIPNTFSPNNDGSNDIFYIRAKGIATIQFLRILSRSGELVFEKRYVAPNDISAGWNGTYKGKDLESGVYVYYAEVVCTNNQVLKYAGNVTLLR